VVVATAAAFGVGIKVKIPAALVSEAVVVSLVFKSYLVLMLEQAELVQEM